ncbi:MAG: PAS domain S-box protein, partial [Methanocella sp.]
MKFASFRINLMTTIFLICLVIALLGGSLWLYTAQDGIKSDVRTNVLEDAHLMAQGVQGYSEKVALAGSVVAKDPALIAAISKNDDGTIKAEADRLAASIPDADFVQVADGSGHVIYSTDPALLPDLNTYDWYGVAAQNWQTSITDSYINTVSGKYNFAVLSPVKDGDRMIGHLVTGLSPKALKGVTERYPDNNASNMLIVDGGGRVIYHDSRTPVEAHTNVSAYTPVKMALGGGDGVTTHSDAWDSQERISAFSLVPGTGWGVVVSRTVSDVNAATHNLLAIVGGSLGFLVIGFTAFGYYASKNLSEPIATLSRKAKKVASGGYDTKIDVSGDDELSGIAHAINDMKTELRLKESRAMDGEEQFGLLLRRLPTGVLITGENGDYLDSNSALLDMFGVSEDELAEAAVFDDEWVLWSFFKADGRTMPRESNPLILAYATRRPVKDVTAKIYRPDTGDSAWLKISAEPQLAPDGKVKRVICTFDNFTERRLLEESLKLSRFSTDHSPEEVIWVTSGGRLYSVNDAVCDNLAYTRAELLSMNIWDVDTGLTQDRWQAYWNELRSLKHTRFKSEHLAHDGTVFPTDVSVHHVEHEGQEYAIAFVRDIGELMRAEKNLAIIEADLSRIRTIAKIGTWQWDMQSGRITCSEGTNNIMGISQGECPGSYNEYLPLVHPEDRKDVELTISKAISGDDSFHTDHRLVPASGSVRYIHAEGEVVRDSAGEAVRILGAIQDVTGLRLMEIARDNLQRQLEFEHARLEAVLRNIPAGIVIAEAPSGKILMANQQMEEIFRDKFPLSPDIDAYGEWGVFQSRGLRYDPDGIPLARSIRKGEIVHGEEINFLRGDGTWGLISINSAPIYDKDGHIVDAIATFFDITDSKQAENALRESESNLSKAQCIAHLGNWVWNIQTNEMRYSDELRQIYGIDSDKQVATFDDFMKSVCPDHRSSVRRSINAALNRKEPHSIDFRINRPDGTVRTVHSEGEIVSDDAGKPIRLFGTVQDVSDRKLTEDALREAKMQAELYLDLMSHDINNMNQIGMGYLELAQSRLKLDPDDRELLSKPEEVLRNSSVLIDNVRKTRKAITGELKLGPVDVGSLLEELVARYHDRTDGVIISSPLHLKGTYVMANDLLKDVFTNLLDNAVKHTARPVTIGLGLSRYEEGDRAYYKIHIEDSGPGIPDGQKDTIFERMRRGNTQARGTGLGLYLVKT